MFKRIVILVAIFTGIFFIWKSQQPDVDVSSSEKDEITENETNDKKVEKKDETLLKETPKKVAKKNKKKPSDYLKKSDLKSTIAARINASAAENAASSANQTGTPDRTPATSLPYSTEDQFVKVYLYEWQIDASKKEIFAGKVTFEVQNTGQFSHDFGIKGVRNFGKIIPGATRTFVVSLGSGDFEIYSDKKRDRENGMREGLVVR